MAPGSSTQEQEGREVSVLISDIKASGLPAKVGLFSGLFYVRIKGDGVQKKTKPTRYAGGGEFVATWREHLVFSTSELAKLQIEIFARRFFFSYKVIKKTENRESLADLLVHTDTPVELELLEEGKAAGRLLFRISRNDQIISEPFSPPMSLVSIPSPASPMPPRDSFLSVPSLPPSPLVVPTEEGSLIGIISPRNSHAPQSGQDGLLKP